MLRLLGCRAEIRIQLFQARSLANAVLAIFVPRVDLQADEYTDDDDGEVEADCDPVLPAEMVKDGTKQH